MKTQITLRTSKNNFGLVVFLFICFLSSFNSQSQKIQKILEETWINDAWGNATQTLYSYDGNGYLIHDLTQNWDVSWKDYFQTDYTNNSDGTKHQSISQSWNIGSGLWDDAERVTYTYNAAKKVLTSESEYWFDPDWMPIFKHTNTYDGSGYLTNSLLQSWDYISSWNDSSQTNYTNNPDGTVSQAVTQMWNVNTWKDVSRITNTYAGSKLIMSLYETSNGLVWENNSMDTNDYDGNGYLVHSLSQNWVSNGWKDDYQSDITNYADGNPYQVVSQNWDAISGSWKNDSRITFTYGALAVNENVFNKSITIYPNPAEDRITFAKNDSSPSLKYVVTDLMGKQVLNGSIDAKETVVDIHPLATGIYFIQIMGQNTSQTLKMIKK
jgi:hypothetical protein